MEAYGKIYDILVIGGGPAGMTCAVYASRANKSVCIIEKETFGGQITHSPRVENFPGRIEMTGNEFAAGMVEQISSLGAGLAMGTVVSLEAEGRLHTARTEEGESYTGRAVVIATGTKHRPLGLGDEEDWAGDGLYYCAVCDGALFKDGTTAVIGGGNSALQEAIMLSEICGEVIVVQDLPYLTGEGRLCDIVAKKENIKVCCGCRVVGILADNGVFCGLRIQERDGGAESELSCDGAFVAIGLIAQNDAFFDVVKTDPAGYIVSGEDCRTGVAGIFTAGDCRTKQVRQLTTAAADGAVAALAACRYLEEA
jgi:thioredoxin reductase (NADPH)